MTKVAPRDRQPPGQIMLGVAMSVALVGLALFLARVAIRSFASLDPQVSAALAVAGATVIVVPITRWFERRRLREEPLQTRKVDVYERFIRGFLDNFFDQRRGGMDQAKLLAFMSDVTPDLTIWASDDVLARWSRLRRRWAAGEHSPEASEALQELEALFLAIRQDLGHGNKGLEPGDVLGLWINDIVTAPEEASVGRKSPGEAA